MKYFTIQIKKSIILGIIFNGELSMEKKYTMTSYYKDKKKDFSKVRVRTIIKNEEEKPKQEQQIIYGSEFSKTINKDNI
jgi:hypothetical protein